MSGVTSAYAVFKIKCLHLLSSNSNPSTTSIQLILQRCCNFWKSCKPFSTWTINYLTPFHLTNSYSLSPYALTCTPESTSHGTLSTRSTKSAPSSYSPVPLWSFVTPWLLIHENDVGSLWKGRKDKVWQALLVFNDSRLYTRLIPYTSNPIVERSSEKIIKVS